MNKKTCRDCKQTLPADAFVTSPRGRGGLSTYCRECGSARSRAWAAVNRDANLQSMHAYYEKNREALLKKQRMYYETNKPQLNAQNRRKIANLSDGYVRAKLTAETDLRVADIPQPLVELKRAHLLMLRELRKEDHENR
jgi:hypothetical protein